MPSEVERVLSGGGQCGELARATDWGKTSFGPVERWSQALRSAASLVLHNESGMLLWWGPDFVQLYNEAYRPVLGAKHPRAMGQPFGQCWKEVFHILGPMAEVPYRGGPAAVSDDLSLLIDRKLPQEEVHFRIAYSPVPDETVPVTGIGGVLATVTETTEQVFADRQLRSLRELSVRGAAAVTAGSAQEACSAAALTLASSALDVPFALFYLQDGRGGLQLVAHTMAARDGEGWARVGVTQVRELSVMPIEPGLRLPASPWGYAPREAVVLPLASPDEPTPYGVLLCGISPHRVLDAGYRGFFELAAGQVVTAIRNARALERERKRAEALAEFDRAKTLFFSNISHEFRTPLALILSPLEAAATSPAPVLEGEDLLAALRNAKRLRKLVNQLLDFARIEAKRSEVRWQATDLAALTVDLASAFRSMIEHAGLRLEVDCPELTAPLLVDPEMWEKIGAETAAYRTYTSTSSTSRSSMLRGTSRRSLPWPWT